MVAGPKRLIGIVLVAIVLGGVGPATTQTRATEAKRIVSLVPALTEMLFALGAGPQVIAVSSYDEFPPEVKSLPKVGALLDPDMERILSLRPDLVIVLRVADGSAGPARAGRNPRLQLPARRARRRVQHAAGAGIGGRPSRGRRSACGRDPRTTRRPPGARAGTSQAAHAARLRTRPGLAARRLRQRRRRLSSRHARDRGWRQRVRRCRARVGAAVYRNDARPGAGGHPGGSCDRTPRAHATSPMRSAPGVRSRLFRPFSVDAF